jgi:hypothetical protein
MGRSRSKNLVSLTIKDIGRDVVDELRRRAEVENRSLNREVIHILEKAAGSGPDREDVARQVAAWRALAGGWAGPDGRKIMARRSGSRRIDL